MYDWAKRRLYDRRWRSAWAYLTIGTSERWRNGVIFDFGFLGAVTAKIFSPLALPFLCFASALLYTTWSGCRFSN